LHQNLVSVLKINPQHCKIHKINPIIFTTSNAQFHHILKLNFFSQIEFPFSTLLISTVHVSSFSLNVIENFSLSNSRTSSALHDARALFRLQFSHIHSSSSRSFFTMAMFIYFQARERLQSAILLECSLTDFIDCI
jgi:hypothetical protein